MNNNQFTFSPDWISGFTQSDGSFTISLEKRSKGIAIRPSPVFSISQSNRDLELFLAMQNYLKVGKIYKNREGITFVVKSLNELTSVILPLFDKHPLRGGKNKSYQIFKTVVLMMNNKAHLNIQGLLQIIDLCFFMNEDSTVRNLEKKENIFKFLQEKHGNLPTITSIDLPIYPQIINNEPSPLSLEFVRGQIDGDGSFNIAFRSNSRRIGVNFTVVHETSSISILNELITFFDCGKVYNLKTAAARYQVQNLDDILTKIIPKLSNVKFNTIKQKHFEIFIKVCEILKEKGYNDDLALRNIVNLAWNMNLAGKARRTDKKNYINKFLSKTETFK